MYGADPHQQPPQPPPPPASAAGLRRYADGVGRAHICIQCGLSLARVHAPPDPHYGLPVVVCPRCHAASVRRPFAGDATRRAAVRAWHTAARLFIRLVLLLAASAITVGMTGEIAGKLERACRRQPLYALLLPDDHGTRDRLASELAREGTVVVGVWALAWVATGLTAGVTFPHWRLRGFVLVVPLAGLGLLALAMCFGFAAALGDGLTPLAALRRQAIPWRDTAAFLVPAGIGLGMAAALYPVGRRTVMGLRGRRSLASRLLKKVRRRKARDA